MPDVIIVGDGPGGLSAALFLAKNGKDVLLFGEDKTAMHFAFLNNYLGLPAISGSDFQRIAREQVAAKGARLQASHVDAVTSSAGDGAAAAIDILSTVRGAPVQDWDSPPESK